jgi:hypothetical protein
MNHAEQYALIKASQKKWLENASDPKDKCELPIF